MRMLPSLLLAALAAFVAAAPAAPVRLPVEESNADCEQPGEKQEREDPEQEPRRPKRPAETAAPAYLHNTARPPAHDDDIDHTGHPAPPETGSRAAGPPRPTPSLLPTLHVETGADLRAGLLDLPPPPA